MPFLWIPVVALVISGLSAFALTRTSTDNSESQRAYSRSAQIIAQGLPQAHLTRRELSDPISAKAVRIYLDSLDHDHSVFLASDAEEFLSKEHDLDDYLRRGDNKFAFEVFERYEERIRDRVAYVHKLLEQGFDFDKDEFYQIDRKESPWASDEQEWNEIWRKKIKHEYLSRMISDQLQKEEAEKESEENVEPDTASSEESDTSSDNENLADAENDKTSSENSNVTEETRPPVSIEDQITRRYDQLLHVTEGHDEEFVLQAYLNAFTRAYDVHSAFLSPRANEDFDINMKLSLTGIGALLTLEDGAAKVVRLIKGGPAAKDGTLQPGDKIIAVAQKGEEAVDILNWPLYKSVRLIRGEIGTSVILSVIPATDPTESVVRNITLVRDRIKLEEREAKAEVKELETPDGSTLRVGVITLPEFYADLSGIRRGLSLPKRSATDIRNLLEEMNGENVDGILLDLRNNGGGSLSDAIEMTGYFIDRGPVVQVKANQRVRVERDPNPGMVYDGPLVVLVNRQSASASEILSGALQDYGRAIIVGDSKTHGKGSVQSVFPLDPNERGLGALKITTAGFYRIDGRSTQLKGVEPDVVIPSAMDVMEIGEEYLSNVLPWSLVSPASYKEYQDTDGIVDQLRERSEKRLAENPKYSAYQQLMTRLKNKINMHEISLMKETRFTIAREDQELQKLQEELSATLGPEESDDEEREDIILNEALLILRDLVTIPLHS